MHRFLFEMEGSVNFSSTTIDGKTGQPHKTVDTPINSLACPANWIVERSGRFVILACYDSPRIVSYNIDAKSGAPTGAPNSTPLPKMTTPAQILIDITGQFMYFLESDRHGIFDQRQDGSGLDNGALHDLWLAHRDYFP